MSTNGHLAGRKPTVLVTEDEKGIRDLVRTTLEESGYRVLSACDGCDALERAQNYSGSIDLLLTDRIMPRLGGKELAQRLRVQRPLLKVLYITGYCGTRREEETETVVLKPFSLESLCNKVREILDS